MTKIIDKIINSSEDIKQLSCSPFGKMKGFTHSFSNSFGISFIYKLNKSGLRTHPCLTPRSYGNDSVHRSALFNSMEQFDLLYIPLISLYILPPTFDSRCLTNKPWCHIESKAFLKSTKQAKTFPRDCALTWVSIKVLSDKKII